MAALEGKAMEHLEIRDQWEDRWEPPLKDEMQLSEWQKLGVTFLRKTRESMPFALLGDDMGIGKVLMHSERTR
jgi:hypothetical protein